MVWVLNTTSTTIMLCNVSEETASRLAKTYTSHIYFFADLVEPIEG